MKPNILWICSDQQRWDTLGCYGNRFVHTPNLDRLAGKGALFEHAFSQSPVCTPSRASFLTGRYPRTTRCRQNGQDIPEDEMLITRILADNGYVCGLSGKLHLSACYPDVCKTVERRINDGYSEFHWSHHCRNDWGNHNEYLAWLAEKGASDKSRPHPQYKSVEFSPPEEFHQTTWCSERAMDFMRAHAGSENPWLFSVNIFDPHHGFDAPEDYYRRYEPVLNEIPLPNYVEGELDDKPVWQREDGKGAYGTKEAYRFSRMSSGEHRAIRASYWAMCDLLDKQVGRMLATLEETGQLDRTVVIYSSDHGEMLGDHGIYLKGPYFYEPAIHVPLLISWPGRIAPAKSPALVELMDIPQTLLDAVGLPHHPGMQGKSLWPMLTGKADLRLHKPDVYCEYYNAMVRKRKPTPQLTMLRTNRHKIVVDHNGDGGELYDLKKEPSETRNLWNDAAYAEVKSDMLLRLCNRMSRTVDPLPPRRSHW